MMIAVDEVVYIRI